MKFITNRYLGDYNTSAGTLGFSEAKKTGLLKLDPSVTYELHYKRSIIWFSTSKKNPAAEVVLNNTTIKMFVDSGSPKTVIDQLASTIMLKLGPLL